jgi:hypothetical protein
LPKNPKNFQIGCHSGKIRQKLKTLLSTIYNNRIQIIFLQFFAKHYSNHVQNHARHCANAQTVLVRGYVVFSGLMMFFLKSKMDRYRYG